MIRNITNIQHIVFPKNYMKFEAPCEEDIIQDMVKSIYTFFQDNPTQEAATIAEQNNVVIGLKDHNCIRFIVLKEGYQFNMEV